MVNIQCAAADIRRGKKKIDRRKKPQDENIMLSPIPQGDHNKTVLSFYRIVLIALTVT